MCMACVGGGSKTEAACLVSHYWLSNGGQPAISVLPHRTLAAHRSWEKSEAARRDKYGKPGGGLLANLTALFQRKRRRTDLKARSPCKSVHTRDRFFFFLGLVHVQGGL